MLSKTTHFDALPPPPTPGARGALISVSVFPTLGGLATGMWLEDGTAGVVGYYALLILALLSPEGAGLRHSFGRRMRSSPAAPEGQRPIQGDVLTEPATV